MVSSTTIDITTARRNGCSRPDAVSQFGRTVGDVTSRRLCPQLATLEKASHERAWIDVAKPMAGTCRFGSPPGRSIRSRWPRAPCAANRSRTRKAAPGRATRVRFPGSSGNGRWTETIYYHLLDCGLRIPPTAGSGSGQLPIRWATTDCTSTWDRIDLRKMVGCSCAGRVTVTNGPFIRPNVEGEMPGHVFQGGHRSRDGFGSRPVAFDPR